MYQNMTDLVKVKGEVTLTITHADGSVEHKRAPNLVTNVGQDMIASRLEDATTDVVSHIAMGDSVLAPAKDQTDLQGTEHDRISATVAVENNTITYTATFGSNLAADVSVGEFGLFNASSAGDMFARWTTPQFTLPSDSTLDVSWKLTFGE